MTAETPIGTSPTPETDKVASEWPRESFGAMTTLARKLERERDASREELREARRYAELDIQDRERVERELLEARQRAERAEAQLKLTVQALLILQEDVLALTTLQDDQSPSPTPAVG